MSTHTDPGAQLKRTPEQSFDGLILEADWADMHGGGCHDDNCEVCRDIANVRAAIRQAASHVREGGEPLDEVYKRAWDAYVEFSMAPDHTTFDCIRAVVDAALSPPVKTGGEAEINTDVAQINMDRAPAADEATGDAGSNPVVGARPVDAGAQEPKLTAAGEDELYRVRDIIASHISCEGDCQKRPNGCGCALTAAREIVEGRTIAQEAKHCGDQSHDSRVYFMCESCEEHNPEGAVGPRSDIAVMPDGTWLCDGCYSDCDKSAYGLIASDVDDFVFSRFEDLPRPAPYGAPSAPSAEREI